MALPRLKVAEDLVTPPGFIGDPWVGQRMVRGFLLGLKREDCPAYEIPLHTVMKITYDGWSPPFEERMYLGPEPLAMEPGKPADDGQKHL